LWPTPLFNDFDGTANRKIELAVSAPLIDGDFSKLLGFPECVARDLVVGLATGA
jgi:hypothetical protein